MSFTIVNKTRLHQLQKEVGTLRGKLLDAQLEIAHLNTLLDKVVAIAQSYVEDSDEEDTRSLVVVEHSTSNGTGDDNSQRPVGRDDQTGSATPE